MTVFTTSAEISMSDINNLQQSEWSGFPFWLLTFQRSESLAHALPERELGGERIVNKFGPCVEAHRRPADEIVFGPTAIARGRKGNPSPMHRCRERLWWMWAKKRLSSEPERVKYERDLYRMGGTEASAELRRAPSEFVHVGGGTGGSRVGLGHSNSGDAPVPIGLDCREQLTGAGGRIHNSVRA